jgi:hypothetical protein
MIQDSNQCNVPKLPAAFQAVRDKRVRMVVNPAFVELFRANAHWLAQQSSDAIGDAGGLLGQMDAKYAHVETKDQLPAQQYSDAIRDAIESLVQMDVTRAFVAINNKRPARQSSIAIQDADE